MHRRGERATCLTELHADRLPRRVVEHQVRPTVAVDVGKPQPEWKRSGQDVSARVEAPVSVTPQHEDLQGGVGRELRDQVDVAVPVEVGGTADEVRPIRRMTRGWAVPTSAISEQREPRRSGTDGNVEMTVAVQVSDDREQRFLGGGLDVHAGREHSRPVVPEHLQVIAAVGRVQDQIDIAVPIEVSGGHGDRI